MGGGEISNGFGYVVGQLTCDAMGMVSASGTAGCANANGVSQVPAAENLQGRQTWATQGLPAVPKSSTACSAIYGPAMQAWEAALQAWIKANPNQPPPPSITTPPQLNGGCG